MKKMKTGISTTVGQGQVENPFKVKNFQTMMRKRREGCKMKEESLKTSFRTMMMTFFPVMAKSHLLKRKKHRNKKFQARDLLLTRNKKPKKNSKL